MSLNDFLMWLVGSGGAIACASFIVERWPWFLAKTAEVKEWLFFVIASTLSVAGYVVINYVPADVLASIAPYFALIAGVFINVVIGKLFHEVDKTS